METIMVTATIAAAVTGMVAMEPAPTDNEPYSGRSLSFMTRPLANQQMPARALSSKATIAADMPTQAGGQPLLRRALAAIAKAIDRIETVSPPGSSK